MGELSPVAQIDGRAMGSSIDPSSAAGGGERWPITRRIQAAYRLLTETEGVPLPF